MSNEHAWRKLLGSMPDLKTQEEIDTMSDITNGITTQWVPADLTGDEIAGRNEAFQAGYRTGWGQSAAWRRSTKVCAWCNLILVAPATAHEHVKVCSRAPYRDTIGKLERIEALLSLNSIGLENEDVLHRLMLLVTEHVDLKRAVSDLKRAVIEATKKPESKKGRSPGGAGKDAKAKEKQ